MSTRRSGGASYTLQVHPDRELDAYLDGVIAKIAAAQEPDGYLFTARTTDPAHPQPGIGAERWVEETVSHELYNAGHLYEPAVAHFLATGKRTLLDVAVKNADLVVGVFGPDRRRGFPGHQEIELALVKLYRVTGTEKYFNLAKYFLDQRGRDVKLTQYPPGSRFAIYNNAEQIQAHKPILEQDEAVGHAGRTPWFGVACCPGNISRFIPSFPGYIYAVKDETLYVNLFVSASAKIGLRENSVGIRQETRYPWAGEVKMILEPDKTGDFSLHIRIPGWARNQPVPGDLYAYLDKNNESVVLKVNGSPTELNLERGFARIRRAWKKGDTVELSLPMPVRRVVAHDAVKDDAGKLALERGPLVYCAEGPDNGGKVLNLALADGAPLESEFRADLFKGVVVLKGKAGAMMKNSEGTAGAPAEQDFLAIPYYAWAHRGPSEMAVWLKRK